MNRKKILMTGGTGLLGSEIRKLDPDIITPLYIEPDHPQNEFDIVNFDSVLEAIEKYSPDIVLHLAAATKPPEHEKNPDLGIHFNIIGTANVARACVRLNKKLVYTSSDYVYYGSGPHKEDEPVLPRGNFYWSKFGGECAVRLVPDHLILRLSFGPAPFPWDKVYEKQYNSKLYIDEMAPLVLAAAKSDAKGVMNLGGPRTTLEDYAKRTRQDIEKIPKPETVASDTSLDISKMKKELNIDDGLFFIKTPVASELEPTGKRFILGKSSKRVENDTRARYAFASNFVKGKKVLDISCGTGFGTDILKRQGLAKEVDGVDISADLIKYAQTNFGSSEANFYIGDIIDFGKDSSYDVIVCYETIQQVKDYMKAFKNFYRLLKPGGMLLISSVNRRMSSPRNLNLEDKPIHPFHAQEFTFEEMKGKLEEVGFFINKGDIYGSRQQLFFKNRYLRRLYKVIFKPDIRFSPEFKPLSTEPRYFMIVASKN